MKPFVIATLMFQAAAYAGLQWEKKELEFRADASAGEVKAEFNFTNTGDGTVTIESVQSSCGCTTAVLDKKTYQHGEKGHITAVFNIGQRTGLQQKSITVRIEGEPQPTILIMVTHIAELMTINPQFVFWRTGDPLEPKTIELTALPNAKLTVTKLMPNDSRFTTTLETIEEGKSYKAIITPQQTATAMLGIITIQTVVAPNEQKFFTAYAQVKPVANYDQAAE